jgi:probable phosphoglycerate mutase
VIDRALDAAGDTVVFAHGHILRILGARWMGLGPDGGAALALGTAALCILGFERERRVVWLWNDTSHVPPH